jgi:hypothetical protein
MLLARLWFFIIPSTLRSSITTVWFSPRILLTTCCPVTGVAVVNPINVAVTGAAMVNNTERLVYFNKVRGVLRLMDCCVPTTAASASETDVDE